MERNERRLTRRVLKTGPIGDLPLNLIEVIWREVRNAGRRARGALLRHIRVARTIDYWLWQWWEGQNETGRLMNQMTQHWLNLGRIGWTPREVRMVERRRYTHPHRNQPHMQWYLGSPLWWQQWGVGDR